MQIPLPLQTFIFWNDKNNQKFNEAYFNKYPNQWHHGDYAENTVNDGFIIHGRSDATLNSGGVRIGTAELYRVVENIENVVVLCGFKGCGGLRGVLGIFWGVSGALEGSWGRFGGFKNLEILKVLGDWGNFPSPYLP